MPRYKRSTSSLKVAVAKHFPKRKKQEGRDIEGEKGSMDTPVRNLTPYSTKKRNEQILTYYRSGDYTLAQIGDIYGLTRERIRQVLNKQIAKEIKTKIKRGEVIKAKGKTVTELVHEEMSEIQMRKARKRVWKAVEAKEKKGIVPENFPKYKLYAKAVGISEQALKKYAPSRFLRGRKRWSWRYLRCRNCGTTSVKHRSHGLCRNCYVKSDLFKEMQRSSRLRSLDGRRLYQRKYLRGYYRRPEVKFRNRNRNREKIIRLYNGRCVLCGLTRKENRDRYSKDLTVFYRGSDKKPKLSDFVTLCESCFQRYKMKGLPKTYL